MRATSSGGAGDVLRSNRRISSIGIAVAGRDLLVGRLPAVARGLGRQAEGDRCRAHAGPSVGPAAIRPRRRPVKRASTALRWAVRPSAVGEAADGLADRGQAALVDPLDLGAATERLDRRAGRTSGRGRRWAGRGSRRSRSRRRTPAPTARRRSSRVADPGGGGIRIADIDREVLGGVGVDERDRRRRGPAASAIRPWTARARPRIVAPLEAGQEGRDLALDGVRERPARRHEDGRRVRAVLGLRDEVGGDEHGIGAVVGEDHPLGRTGRQVDPDEPRDLELGGRDPGVARSDDPVDGGERRDGVREPERETRRSPGRRRRRGGRRPRAGPRRRAGPGGRRRRRPAGDATTISPTPATRAGTTVMTSDDGYGADPPGT